LTDRVRQSRLDEAEAESRTLEFLEQYVPSGKSPMCGNSICQDRRFLARCMPKLEAFFHYRNLDVSTLKELANRWAPDVAKGFKKESSHLALDDIKDSIDEMQYYRKNILTI
jgi:oligoribonuclease